MKRREFITRTMPSIILLALLVAVSLPRPAPAQTETFRDASGRVTGTASRDANGTRTFRDASGRVTGTATAPRGR
jgi:YD repeat-containing protein